MLNKIKLNFIKMYVTTSLIILIGILIFGYTYPQKPYSDFLIHWNQGRYSSMYIKGGFLVYIYSIFSYLKFEASTAALIINSISWVVFSASCYPGALNYTNRRVDIAINNLIILITISFGYWWIAVASTVEVMTVHVAMLCAGLKIFIYANNKLKKIVGAVIVGLALSMRMQVIVALLFATIFYLIIFIIIYKKDVKKIIRKEYILAVLFSVAIGISIELFLRNQSNNQTEIEVMQRSQLYIGLINSDKKLPSCGAWSQEAINNAEKELNQSLFSIVEKFVEKESIVDISSIVVCKITRSMFSKFYVWWIPEAGVSQNGKEFNSIRSLYIAVEIVLNIIGRISICILLYLLFCKIDGIKLGYKIIIVSIFFGFMSVYALLEFNPRYQFQLVACLVFATGVALSSSGKNKLKAVI